MGNFEVEPIFSFFLVRLSKDLSIFCVVNYDMKVPFYNSYHKRSEIVDISIN